MPGRPAGSRASLSRRSRELLLFRPSWLAGRLLAESLLTPLRWETGTHHQRTGPRPYKPTHPPGPAGGRSEASDSFGKTRTEGPGEKEPRKVGRGPSLTAGDGGGEAGGRRPPLKLAPRQEGLPPRFCLPLTPVFVPLCPLTVGPQSLTVLKTFCSFCFHFGKQVSTDLGIWLVALSLKTHQRLPRALWRRAKLAGAEKCLPVPTSSASSLSPPALAPPSAACPPPPPSGEPHAQPGPRHLQPLVGTCLPASSPARLCLEPFVRPRAPASHHYSVVPAAHDSSARPVGPTPASSHVLGAPTAATADLSSADSRHSEFVPQSASAQTGTKSASCPPVCGPQGKGLEIKRCPSRCHL